MEISPGMSILNGISPPAGQFGPAYGTIGGVVYKNNNPFLLTCFHCIENPATDFDNFVANPGNNQAVTLLPNQTTFPIGTIIDARMTITVNIDPANPALNKNLNLDIALIKPDLINNTLVFEIPVYGKVRGSRVLADSEKGSVKVFKYGKKTFDTPGTFIGMSTINLTYLPRPESRYFNRVIMVSGGADVFGEGGDSGSFILDEGNSVVGLLFATDNKIAYGICPDLIETAFGITFNP